MVRRQLARLGAVAAAAVLVAGCSSTAESGPERGGATPTAPASTGSSPATTGPPGEGLAGFYEQELSWQGCGGGFECARLQVPVDYAAPAGRTIGLALVRLPASGDEPLGSLVVNPGGPGASGVAYARAAEAVVSRSVRGRYDVVGFDPRGVARSAPLSCLTDRQLDAFLAIDGSPDGAAEEQALVRAGEQLGRGCLADKPALAGHMGTADVARDLDVLRAALGDRRLTYLGKSYGTYIGTTYAELFPARVGRLVLDGQLDPAASGSEIALGQAAGFHRALRSFLADCLTRSRCPLSGDADSAQAQLSRLFDRVDSEPLDGEPGRPVTEALAVLGVAAALYDENSWPLLRQAIAEAKRGSGSLFLALADFYSDRGPNGRYTTNGIEALYAVTCLDRPETGDLASFRAAAARAAAVSPVFGEYIAWGNLPCASWPAPAEGAPHPVVADGAPPILVVGTTRDPATPYEWAESVARSLASGRLLTLVGDGHTAYRQGNECIDEAVDAYLVDGTLPAAGTRCG